MYILGIMLMFSEKGYLKFQIFIICVLPRKGSIFKKESENRGHFGNDGGYNIFMWVREGGGGEYMGGGLLSFHLRSSSMMVVLSVAAS